MDAEIALILNRAESMAVFAGEDKTFRYGEWKAWYAACVDAGRTLPSDDFKADRCMPKGGDE